MIDLLIDWLIDWLIDCLPSKVSRCGSPPPFADILSQYSPSHPPKHSHSAPQKRVMTGFPFFEQSVKLSESEYLKMMWHNLHQFCRHKQTKQKETNWNQNNNDNDNDNNNKNHSTLLFSKGILVRSSWRTSNIRFANFNRYKQELSGRL